MAGAALTGAVVAAGSVAGTGAAVAAGAAAFALSGAAVTGTWALAAIPKARTAVVKKVLFIG
ncbi:MAG: hypothetical protein EOO11_07190 [Chitinophagaceae bacterium]|nr:MAG: hypothetical protein EOO11_07190 [Chitinophagaceae bacterium]